MRIISGKWKGKRLLKPNQKHKLLGLRPTMDRVRETIFNILIHKYSLHFNSQRVLDLFSGTGALGFEAMSRGANSVCFVEFQDNLCKKLRENSSHLGIVNKIQILNCDARNLRNNQSCGYNLVFLDPPYGQNLGEEALLAALNGSWISDDAIIVWEENNEIFPPSGLRLIDKRLIGDTHLNFLHCD